MAEYSADRILKNINNGEKISKELMYNLNIAIKRLIQNGQPISIGPNVDLLYTTLEGMYAYSHPATTTYGFSVGAIYGACKMLDLNVE